MNSSDSDAMIVPPATKKLFGWASNTGKVSTMNTGTIDLFTTQGSHGQIAVTAGVVTNISGTGSQYSGAAHKAESSFNIGINSYSDSNGNTSAPWISPAQFNSHYIIAGFNDWVAVVAEKEMDVEIVDASTGKVYTRVHLNGSKSGGVYSAYISDHMRTGVLVRAVDPGDQFGLWYQPSFTQSYQVRDDETFAFGFD